ncbi:hypothetical protein KFU94_41355 [Chloroflexi bacterium TSY]|nr:hypothetical protein [Chloroflexi bacterium TSY]
MKVSLDAIRGDLIKWAESLWLVDIGAFRNGDVPTPDLPSSLFMTYILYSMEALDAVAVDQDRWVAWIQSQQNERDGSYVFPARYGMNRPRHGIALWNAVRSLGMLGSGITRFPAYQRDAMTTDGLRSWFAAWKESGLTHHEVLALAPTLASHPDPDWVDVYFDELVKQQHPTLGTWPRESETANISRTFAYSLVHLGMDRVPPQPEKIVDAMLNLQDEDGFWHGKPDFATMDAVSVDPNLAFLAIFSRDCRDFGVIYSDFGYRKQPISYLKIAQI